MNRFIGSFILIIQVLGIILKIGGAADDLSWWWILSPIICFSVGIALTLIAILLLNQDSIDHNDE